MEERMKQLKEQGTYLIERVGANNKRRVLVDDFDVLDCSDTVDLIEHMKKVDLIACCVYEGAFQSICQNLKEAIEYRTEHEHYDNLHKNSNDAYKELYNHPNYGEIHHQSSHPSKT